VKKVLLSLISSAVLLSAGDCTLAQIGNVDVTWKAFKTASKIGVGGNFVSVRYNSDVKEAKNFKKLLVGSKIYIQTNTVFSNNTGRDAKLVQFFFNQMQGQTIDGTIVDVKSDEIVRGKPKTGLLMVETKMNNVTKVVPMKFSFSDGFLTGKGYIDLFDFNAAPALSAINKACFELHQGKTWSDVEVGFKMGIKATCNR